MGHTLANFHWSGNLPRDNDRLNKWQIGVLRQRLLRTTMQDVSRVKGGVIYGDKDPNFLTVKQGLFRINEEGSMMLR